MASQINYGLVDHRKTVSRFGIASFVGGIVGLIYLLYLWMHGHWDTASQSVIWLFFVPLVVVPSLAIAFGIVAIVRRHRLWWLALFGLPLGLIPLGLVALEYVALRYFS